MLKSYGTIGDESEKITKTTTYGFVYFTAITAALNAVGMGMSLTYTSSSSSSMMDRHSTVQMTMDQITWIASVIQLSAILGGCISGYLSKTLGRKAVLMFNSVPFMGSWLIVAYAPTVNWIYVGRLITGFCSGVVTVTVPTYLIEISCTENRGLLGSFFNLAMSVGVLISMSLGTIITWRWLAIVGATIVTFNLYLMYFIPESPHWLIAKGYKLEACRALKFLRRNNEIVTSDYNKISDSITNDQSSFKLSSLAQPSLYKAIIFAVALTFFQQFCGINPLMAYTTEIFDHIGGFLSPNFAALAISGVQVLSSAFGSVLLDKAGRRVFFVLSGLLISLGLITIGTFVLLSDNDTSFNLKFGWMPVSGYVIFLIAFGLGFGPLPFIMTAEMTPLNARSAVMGVATVSVYFFSFISTKTFTNFQILLTSCGVYFMYALITILGVVFGIFFLPETQGRSLKEIQGYLMKNSISEDIVISTNINEP